MSYTATAYHIIKIGKINIFFPCLGDYSVFTKVFKVKIVYRLGLTDDASRGERIYFWHLKTLKGAKLA